MKARPSSCRRGDLSIGEVLMVALSTTLALQKMNIRAGNSTNHGSERRDSCNGEEAEDEEIEAEVVGDAGISLRAKLLSKQLWTPSMTSPLYPQHAKPKKLLRVCLQLHRHHREMNSRLSSRL